MRILIVILIATVLLPLAAALAPLGFGIPLLAIAFALLFPKQ